MHRLLSSARSSRSPRSAPRSAAGGVRPLALGVLCVAAVSAAALATLTACGSDNRGPTAIDSTTASGLTISIDSGSNAQMAPVGTPITVTVHLHDANGNAVASTALNWTVQSGHGSVSPATTTTGANGESSAQWTMGDTAQIETMSVSLIGAEVLVTATGTAGAPLSLSKAVPDSQAVVSGGAVQLIARAVDQFGNGVPGVTVTWTASGGSIAPASSATGSSGDAAVTFTTAATPATYTITAAAPGLQSVTFTLTGT
jgi:hypothetical protein